MKMRKGILRAFGREVKRASEDSNPGRYRTNFMRDRDRILYSKLFRRLSRKTQIFIPASDDHVRTRLTHSLEVLQISAVSAQFLGLDRDLVEAIALGHDLGHTPFGHTGERVLNLFMTNCDQLGGLSIKLQANETGFKHNLQGLRQSIELTHLYENIRGLNLSNFTLWGVQNHTGSIWKHCDYRYKSSAGTFYCNYPQRGKNNICIIPTGNLSLTYPFYDRYKKYYMQKNADKEAWSFEGLLVAVADEISQRHHDIEDGLIAKVIQEDDIIELTRQFLFPYFNKDDRRIFKTLNKSDNFIQKISRLVVGCLNRNLISNSYQNFKSFCNVFGIKNRIDFEEIYKTLKLEQEFSNLNKNIKIKDIISYPLELKGDEKAFKSELGKVILSSYPVQRMDGKARFIIRQLTKAYLTNPQQLPDGIINQLFDVYNPDGDESRTIPIGDKRAWLNEIYFSSSASILIKNYLLRLICDFIASMTDDFALREHARLYSTSENIDLRHY